MITRLLVAINVIVYLWERSSGALATDDALINHGALLGRLAVQGEWWRILTSAFLHGSDLHILFNMIALWQVGRFVEQAFGWPRMLAVYLFAALGSGLAVVYLTPDDATVGASGAIFGLFGALVACGMRVGPAGRSLVMQSVGVIVLNLLIGFSVPNISNVGHIGGLIAGFLLGYAIFPMPDYLRTGFGRPVASAWSERPTPRGDVASYLPYATPIDPREARRAVTIEHEPSHVAGNAERTDQRDQPE